MLRRQLQLKYSTVAARVAACLEVADSGMAAAVETGEKAREIYQEYILISITQDMTVT